MRCIWLKSLFDFLIKTLFKSWLYASAVTFLLLLICSYIDMLLYVYDVFLLKILKPYGEEEKGR